MVVKSADYLIEDENDGYVVVDANLSRDAAQFKVIDEGPGFDHASLPKPEDVVSADEPGGRGITKMRLFTNEVRFNDKGNEICMKVRRTHELES